MLHDQYLHYLCLMHFTDNKQQIKGKNLGRLWPVLTYEVNFRKKFKPFQDYCTDENLVWRCRHGFIFYIPLKQHRFGIKLLLLCDTASGYIKDFIQYIGKEIMGDPELGIYGSIVKTLLSLNLGKVLNSCWQLVYKCNPFLHKNNTGACGTVKTNRKIYQSCQTSNVVRMCHELARIYCLKSVLFTYYHSLSQYDWEWQDYSGEKTKPCNCIRTD